ncbi:hypothetical protein WDU94_004847 [Cyamophila willieti]
MFISSSCRTKVMINCARDCVIISARVCNLHQTWKWLHQTITLHDFLIKATSTARVDKITLGENF